MERIAVIVISRAWGHPLWPQVCELLARELEQRCPPPSPLRHTPLHATGALPVTRCRTSHALLLKPAPPGRRP